MWSKPKSSKSHHQSNPKSSKSSFKTDQSTKASPKQAKAASSDTQAIMKYQGPSPLPDMSLFWKKMTRDKVQANPTSKIIAVVGRDEVKELKKLIEKKKKAKEDNIAAEIIVTYPNHLQKKIDSLAEAGHKIPALHLIVSSAIESIAYHISGLFRNVQIGPCVTGQPNALRIGSNSTYCDFRTYAWDNRPTHLLESGRSIYHKEGCHWDLSDCRDEANKLLNPSLVSLPSLEEKELAKAMDQCAEVREKHMRGSSPNSGGLREKDDTPAWLTHWKAILGTAVSAVAAAGFSGTCGFFWYSSSGLLIKGPFGLSLALGHTTSVLTGGALLTAAKAAAATAGHARLLYVATALVYYIPKDTVFDFLKKIFWKIWDAICDVAAWLWEKVKDISASFFAVFDGTWS